MNRGMIVRFGLLAFATAQVVLSQTATLTGRATDSSGLVVPQVRIAVTNEGTAQTIAVESNLDGYYTAAPLLPGVYTVVAQKAGFATITQKGLQVVVNQVARLDLTLTVAAVSQQLEVIANAVLLDTDTSERGHLVQGAQLTDLPILGRNTDALAGMVPGVRTTKIASDIPTAESSSFISVNGSRGLDNTFLLDGAPNTAPHAGWMVVHAAADSILEFKVQTSNYSAEYGRTLGGIFNVVTKGGTNEVHATAWDYLRNTVLNANNFFANRSGTGKLPLRFNQFGATFAGPVDIPRVYNGKNRTFFFFSSEFVREAQGVVDQSTVPTAQQLAGNFSNTFNSQNQLITIYDPVTTTLQSNGTYARTPFPNNVIPQNRINPVAANIAALWPAPNQTGTANNYIAAGDNTTANKNISIRGDQYLGEHDRFFGRFTVDNTTTSYFPNMGLHYAELANNFYQFPLRAYSGIVQETHIFNPTTVATGRISFTREAWDRTPFTAQTVSYGALGFPSSFYTPLPVQNLFPEQVLSGYTQLGYSQRSHFGWNQASFQGDVLKTFSRHMLKIGGEFRNFRYNCNQILDSPQFTYSPTYTQGPNATASSLTAGQSVATFLLGVAGGTVNYTPTWAAQMLYGGAFIEDDWKATSRLTLNLGLRWEVDLPMTERYNQIANFNYTASNPVQIPGMSSPQGELTFVGVNGNPRGAENTDWRDFAPRVGFAYRVGSDTVLRGGYGIFYGNQYASWRLQQGASGFGDTSTLVTSLNGVTPTNFLNNPYPQGLLTPAGSSLGGLSLLGQTIQYYDRGNRTPYSLESNITIQHQFPGRTLLEVAYVNSHSLRLIGGQRTGRVYDQLTTANLALGNALLTQVPNPYYGLSSNGATLISSGAMAGPTIPYYQLLRQFPQFTSVQSINGSWGKAVYNALQAKVERRISKSLLLLFNYTFSKSMDNASYFTGEDFSSQEGENAIQNWNDLGAEYGVSQMDQTQRVTATAIYQLPFTRKRSGLLGQTLGGWELALILTGTSGAPLGIFDASNTTNSQAGIMRPNWNGQDPCVSNPTPQQWITSADFSAPAPFAFGNAPRTFGGCRQAGLKEIDLALHKVFRVTERLKTDVSIDSYNLTNSVEFGSPGVTYGASTFGVVSDQNNRPRIIEVSLRLLW